MAGSIEPFPGPRRLDPPRRQSTTARRPASLKSRRISSIMFGSNHVLESRKLLRFLKVQPFSGCLTAMGRRMGRLHAWAHTRIPPLRGWQDTCIATLAGVTPRDQEQRRQQTRHVLTCRAARCRPSKVKNCGYAAMVAAPNHHHGQRNMPRCKADRTATPSAWLIRTCPGFSGASCV